MLCRHLLTRLSPEPRTRHMVKALYYLALSYSISVIALLVRVDRYSAVITLRASAPSSDTLPLIRVLERKDYKAIKVVARTTNRSEEVEAIIHRGAHNHKCIDFIYKKKDVFWALITARPFFGKMTHLQAK